MRAHMLSFLKYFLTIFVIILIPVYWHYYGPQNFLWLSDIGLLLTVLSLWLHMPLLISIAVVGVLITELIWNIDFFVDLLIGVNIIDLSDYMFDSQYPLMLRGISLFHVFAPIIWIWYLARYGYDKRAFWYTTVGYWMILLVTYFCTDPAKNINWVFLPQTYPMPLMLNQIGWLIILFIGFPLLIFLPTHYFCMRMFTTLRSPR